jgi:hypothetical protein
LTRENAKWIYNGDVKNPTKTRAAEKSGKYNHLLKNHYEGKCAAFFAHGNNGAADYREFSKEKSLALPMLPQSYHDYYKNKDKKFDPIQAILPLVEQCVYSGIFVPDDCVDAAFYQFGSSYSKGNDTFKGEKDNTLFVRAKRVMANLLAHL